MMGGSERLVLILRARDTHYPLKFRLSTYDSVQIWQQLPHFHNCELDEFLHFSGGIAQNLDLKFAPFCPKLFAKLVDFFVKLPSFKKEPIVLCCRMNARVRQFVRRNNFLPQSIAFDQIKTSYHRLIDWEALARNGDDTVKYAIFRQVQKYQNIWANVKQRLKGTQFVANGQQDPARLCFSKLLFVSGGILSLLVRDPYSNKDGKNGADRLCPRRPVNTYRRVTSGPSVTASKRQSGTTKRREYFFSGNDKFCHSGIVAC